MALYDDALGIWHLNNNGDDASVNSNTMTLTGATFTIDAKLGSHAARLDGADDYLNVGSPADLDDIFDGGGTIGLWMNPTNYGETNTGRIFSKSDVSNDFGYNFLLNSGGGEERLQFRYDFDGVANAVWVTDNNSFPAALLGTDSLILVSYDNSNVANDPVIRLNNSSLNINESVAPVGTRVSDATKDLNFGIRAATDKEYEGDMDEIMVFNKMLSDAEASFLWNGGAGRELAEVSGRKSLMLTGVG